MNKQFLNWLFIIAFLLNSCINKEADRDPVYEADFYVDSTLLSLNELLDSSRNFKLSIPVNWVQMDNVFQDLLDNINVPGAKYGYLSPLDTSNMILIAVEHGNKGYYEKLRANYLDFLSDSIWQDVSFTQFTYKCHFVEQYLLQNSQILSFRLIAYDGKFKTDSLPKFELIYNVNRANYNSNIKKVESSIGSLDCLTQ